MGQLQNTFNAAAIGALGATKVKDIASGIKHGVKLDVDGYTKDPYGEFIRETKNTEAAGANVQLTDAEIAETSGWFNGNFDNTLGTDTMHEADILTATKDLVNIKKNMKTLQKVNYNAKLRAAKSARMKKEGI